MDRYQKIRDALAMGPTRGIRYARGQEVSGPYGVGVAWCGTNMTSGRDGSYSIDTTEACANASLAAACDPGTIQALLDERDSLAAKVKASRELMLAAAKEIAIMSDDIKESHTVDDAWGDSECDRHAEEDHDYLEALADKLLRAAQ